MLQTTTKTAPTNVNTNTAQRAKKLAIIIGNPAKDSSCQANANQQSSWTSTENALVSVHS